jgi:hypothetical protein
VSPCAHSPNVGLFCWFLAIDESLVVCVQACVCFCLCEAAVTEEIVELLMLCLLRRLAATVFWLGTGRALFFVGSWVSVAWCSQVGNSDEWGAWVLGDRDSVSSSSDWYTLRRKPYGDVESIEIFGDLVLQMPLVGPVTTTLRLCWPGMLCSASAECAGFSLLLVPWLPRERWLGCWWLESLSVCCSC